MKIPLLPLKLLSIVLAWLLVCLLAACSTVMKVPQAQYLENQNDCVVLLHGLWRSSMAMNSIEDYLDAQGYQTVNVDYPSTEFDIATLSQRFLLPGVRECESKASGQVHLVSHSMGGILVRDLLQTYQLREGSKVVMLSPPNQGSELSERFGNRSWYECVLGPAGTSLSSLENGVIPSLSPVDADIGIIAAYKTWSLWPAAWLPTPNDGTVSVQSMVLPEMNDFVAVNVGHAMMRYNDVVHQQIVRFLQTGLFESTLMTAEDQEIVEQTLRAMPVTAATP